MNPPKNSNIELIASMRPQRNAAENLIAVRDLLGHADGFNEAAA